MLDQVSNYTVPNSIDDLLTFYRTACGTLENSFEFDSLSPNATAYGYCTLMDQNVLTGCTNCLAQSDEFYVTNCMGATNNP